MLKITEEELNILANDNYLTAKEDMKAWNIKKEHDSITRRIKKNNNKYDYPEQKALHLTLKYMINAAKHDPINGDNYNENKKKQHMIKEAGEILNKKGGLEAMHNAYLWYYVPKKYKREIDYLWDGIGEWKS
jgi:hypothetical protein